MQQILPKKQRVKFRVIGILLLLVGIIGILFPFLSFRFSEDYTFLNTTAKTLASQAGPTFSATPDPNLPQIKNRLIIVKAGISMPIFQSDNPDVLLKGGWLFPGTAEPGTVGNAVIFGHRFRYLPPISNTFFHLDRLKADDTFQLAWKGSVIEYRVTEKKIIEPTDLSVLDPSTDGQLTLITCAPLFSTKQRLVIVAKQI